MTNPLTRLVSSFDCNPVQAIHPGSSCLADRLSLIRIRQNHITKMLERNLTNVGLVVADVNQPTRSVVVGQLMRSPIWPIMIQGGMQDISVTKRSATNRSAETNRAPPAPGHFDDCMTDHLKS